jgi:hypothetical protein
VRSVGGIEYISIHVRFTSAFVSEPPFEETPPVDQEQYGPEQVGAWPNLDEPGDCDGALDPDLEAAACAALNDLEAAEAAVNRLDADGTLSRLDAGRRWPGPSPGHDSARSSMQ